MVKKKNKKDSGSDLYNFRAGSSEKKDEFKERAESLKDSKNLIPRDIFEDGLLVNEGRDTEQTLLNKKAKEMAVRDNILDKLIASNALIRAYNLRLKSINERRYASLKEDNGTIELYDKNGNRIL